MSIVLSTLAIVFAALCVWLGVRIYNRRERWAKWTLAVIVGVPALYVLSFGPACWTCANPRGQTRWVSSVYIPLGWIILHSLPLASDVLSGYARLGMPKGSSISVPFEPFSIYSVEITK
jgi:hypothetical protein